MLAFFLLAEALPAQQPPPYLTIEGQHPKYYLGVTVAMVEDTDGDGADDLVAGGLSANGYYTTNRLYSGRTGEVLHDWVYRGLYSLIGWVDNAGDVDGDGFGDVVMSLLDQNRGYLVAVRSGKSGALIREHLAPGLGYYTVAGGGDFDADGFDDYLVYEEEFNSSDGGVTGFSGATGARAFRVGFRSMSTDARITWTSNLGEVIAFAGDVDGDGHDDFIAGDRTARGHNLVGVGGAGVFSGRDQSLLFWFLGGTSLSDEYGTQVDGGHDVNGDGVPDLLASAWSYGGQGVSRGLVEVFSGADGSLLHRWLGEGEQESLGKVARLLPDANGDGLDDIMVVSWGTAQFHVMSGADGSKLLTIENSPVIGDAGDAGLDVNDDGWPDVVQADDYWKNSAGRSVGRIVVYPSLPVLDGHAAQGDQVLAGQQLLLESHALAPGLPVWLGYGLHGLEPTPIPALGIVADVAGLQPLTCAVSNAAGGAEWNVHVPLVLQGRSLWLQAVQPGWKTNLLRFEVE